MSQNNMSVWDIFVVDLRVRYLLLQDQNEHCRSRRGCWAADSECAHCWFLNTRDKSQIQAVIISLGKIRRQRWLQSLWYQSCNIRNKHRMHCSLIHLREKSIIFRCLLSGSWWTSTVFDIMVQGKLNCQAQVQSPSSSLSWSVF